MQSTTSTNIPQLSDAPQAIAFSVNEGVCSADIHSNTVIIGTDAGKHNHGSSKVKLKNVVAYNWEARYYSGQLVAVHKSGDYLAYAVKVPNKTNPSTWSGMVRVIHKVTDQWALLKGMKGEIQDLQFAHIDNQILLASIDEHGHTYIHSIEYTKNELRSALLLEILNSGSVVGRHRVTWCPYIDDDDQPDPDTQEDNAKLLVTTHYNIARIYKVWGIVSKLEDGCNTVSVKNLMGEDSENMLSVSEHTDAIVDAAFSPDGTALATASADGYVTFYQVYMVDEKTPRCLHRWQPHEGKPLSCLFFLDDHKNYSSEVQFWKFAITGADNNQMIKIWCCKSWECHQTIMFAPDIMGEISEPSGFKAVLDAGAKFLLLSDFKRRCLYVLNLKQEAENNIAYCSTISEFLMPFPLLSYAIADAGVCPPQLGDYAANGIEDENGSPTGFDHVHDLDDIGQETVNGDGEGQKTLLKLYLIQPKGLQEATLIFTDKNSLQERRMSNQSDLDSVPPAELSPEPKDNLDNLDNLDTSEILQQQSQQLKNILLRARNTSGGLIGQCPDSPPTGPQLNLMTPDAFSSPKRDEDDRPLSATPDPAIIPVNLVKSPGAAYEIEEAPPKYTSGSSSPSREVQEIMSLKKTELVDTEAPDATDADEYLVYKEMKTTIPLAKETIWPSITIAQINEANQRKASSDKSANQSLNQSISNSIVNAGDQSNADVSINEDENCSEVNQAMQRIERMSLSSYDRSRLDNLEHKMDKITELVAEQNRMLRSLCEQSTPEDPRDAIERSLHAHTEITTNAIDNAFEKRWSRVEKAAAGAGATAADAVGAGMARLLEQLTRSLQHEFALRMTATDARLRDNIDKLVNSKSIQESVGAAVGKSISSSVRDSFRDMMSQNLIPSVEKALAQIFKQCNQTFQAGTKEFTSNTQEMARLAAERGAAAALESLRHDLQRHAESLASLNNLPMQITPVVHSALTTGLKQEMHLWREQVALEMSRSHTPATPRISHTPQVDRQMQVNHITSLIKSGDVNGAFQVALSASELSLVVHACRTADPGRVFSPSCQLKQNVLLSLVQQLSADMGSDTALKHRYLEEAVVNLDPSNPVTREHMPVIVRELKRQLTNFISANPSHALTRQMKMLLMATESLIASAAI